MLALTLGEPGAPGFNRGNRIPHRFEALPSGQLEAAFAGNNIDFVDLEILQAKGRGVADPACM